MNEQGFNSKPSNVIKILNPIHPNSQDYSNKIINETLTDHQKTQNRDQRFTSEILAEKEGQLNHSNPSMSSSNDDDQLDDSSNRSSNLLEDDQNVVEIGHQMQVPSNVYHIENSISNQPVLTIEQYNGLPQDARGLASAVVEGSEQYHQTSVKISINNLSNGDDNQKKRTFSQAFQSEEIMNDDNHIDHPPSGGSTNYLNQYQQQSIAASTTIRLNLGSSLVNSQPLTAKNGELPSQETKRVKTGNEFSHNQSYNEPPQHLQQIQQFQPQIQTAQQKYDDLFKRAISNVLCFNRQMTQIRIQNRQHFAIENMKKKAERNQLHQNHNSFLHCNYQPGQNFLNYMNQINYQKSTSYNQMNYGNAHYSRINSQKYNHSSRQFQIPQSHQTNIQQPASNMLNQSVLQKQSTIAHFMGSGGFQTSTSGNNLNFQTQRPPFGISSVARDQANQMLGEQDQSRLEDVRSFGDKLQENESPNKRHGDEKLHDKGNQQQDGVSGDQQLNVNNSNSANDFVCISCHRGHPFTKKYAKNQCQTCYKKTKKYQKDSEDYYAINQLVQQPNNVGFQQPYPPYSGQISHYDLNMSPQLMNGHYKSYVKNMENGLSSAKHRSQADESEIQQDLVE
ncbi:UNKNOWN [Stylonychia lemnae]|uniref:Uncharacterized protein n=1 Tax=Stylonychia lemnae TaxID=5949 RepID=A0A077ZYN1_STYLE|nr:UNKNOWN [Stylonychia lemnae]|eukprot:CDW73641.1 UNKNOWN [Stylonychia lemnae]